jgi:hypothetical protein
MNTATVDLAVLARTRGRRAELLGRLLVVEPGPAEVAMARAIPSLASAFAHGGELASAYARVVLRDVACHEGVFRGPDGQSGRVDPALVAFYARWDFHWRNRWRVAAADHLGLQLLCYAHLCRIEDDAWAGDRPDRAAEAVEAQRTLLADHLGDWGPVAAEALERAGAGTAYAVTAAALAEFLADECGRLRPAADHPGMPAVGDALAVDLSRHGGPARMARRLLAPARAGGYLLAGDIAPLAAAVGAPWHPSDTRSRLRFVLERAVDGARLDVVAAHLGEVVAAWARRWEAERDRQPGAARIFEGWRQRALATQTWLADLPEQPRGRPPVLRVADHDRLAAAVAGLSATGVVVTVDPVPSSLLDRVDAVVRLDPGCDEGWEGDPPGGWALHQEG